MKRVWPVIAVIVLMAIFGGVGCSSSEPMQGQNSPSGSGQPPAGAFTPPAQGPGGGQPGASGGPGVSGTVKSVSGNTIQLTGQDGSAVTVKTDDKTTVQKNVAGTLADIQAGTQILVIGDQSNGTTTARMIQIMAAGGSGFQGPPGQGNGQPGQGGTPPAPNGAPPAQGGTPLGQGDGQLGGRPGLGGTVKSVSGNTIQLTEQDGNTVTVKVDDKTTIQKTTTATVSDIQANMQITVMGDSSSGTIKARMIRIGSTGK